MSLTSFVLLGFQVFSQNAMKADSLIQVLDHTKLSKKARVTTLRNIAYYHPDLFNALDFAKQAQQLAIEIDESIMEAEALEEISHIERRLGNNGASLEASLQALRLYETNGLKEREAASYTQVASNHISDENFNLAIVYLKKAESIYRNSDQQVNYVSTLLNLGEAYRLAGHLDSATLSFKRTLTLNKSHNNKYIESYSLGNIGMVQADLQKWENAKDNLVKAIEILEPLGDPYSTSIYLAELGRINEMEEDWITAEANIWKAFSIASRAGLKEQIRDFSLRLSNHHKTRNNYMEALEYRELYQVYQDSLVNKANIQRVEQLKAGYEIDKRESEIGLLSEINTKQRYFVVLLGIGVLLLFLFTSLLYQGNNRIRKANSKLEIQKKVISKREEEKALLLRELNHRVKNNLQMISSLLNLQSRELVGHPAEEAILSGRHRVEALSLVHRKLYQDGADTKVQIKEYMEELVLGLFDGYAAKFNPDFDISNISVPIDVAVPLALIVNELTINALKYAYANTTRPSFKLQILAETEDVINLKVIDNGGRIQVGTQ